MPSPTSTPPTSSRTRGTAVAGATAAAEARATEIANARADALEAHIGASPGARHHETVGASVVRQLGDEAAFRGFDTRRTPRVPVPADLMLGRAAVLSGIVTLGDVVNAGMGPDILIPRTILDVIPTTVITEGVVHWVQEIAFTNAAAIVPEQGGDTGSLGAGSLKPFSSYDVEGHTDPLVTIATLLAVSRQVLRYSARTQLRSAVDTRLRLAVRRVLEAQVLMGDGTGDNLHGIVPQATPYNGGYANIAGGAATMADTLRRAITQVTLADYPATAILLNPVDWATIQLLKGTDLHYILATSPGSMGGMTLWGVPVYESNGISPGSFAVGATAATELFTGGDVLVEVTDSHSDWFQRNLLALRAEVEAMFALYRPLAWVSGEFTPTPTT